MRLYDIDQAILACIDTETGEIVDIEALEALQMAREDKLEGVALAIKNLASEAAAIREEEKALAERRRAKENKAESMKKWLSDALGGQPFETARVRLSWRASAGVKVEDLDALMLYLIQNREDCVKYTAPAPNLTELTKLLKTGQEVPGAELESRNNLQIK